LIEASLANGPVGYDSGNATMSREVYTNGISSIWLNMKVAAYSHNNGNAAEAMDSGIRMRLFDRDGTNYANYTYWLACWSYGQDSRTAPDSNTKVIYGRPTLNSWLEVGLFPNEDWTIDWSKCDRVKFEAYVNAVGANGDTITMLFDDFTYIDAPASSYYGYDLQNGNLLYTVDARGLTTSYQYDQLGRVIRTNNTDGTYTTSQFDDVHNKVAVFDELGRKTVSYFDELGRLVKTERYGTSSTPYSDVALTHTWMDNIKTSTDAEGRVTVFTYDYMGRNIRTQYMNGTAFAQSTVSYDDTNLRITKTDEDGHKVVSVMDYLGRLNATREYYTQSSFYETRMTYDAVGNMLTMRTSNGEVTRLSYDSLGQKTSNSYPDGRSESWTYDDAGRISTWTDRAGHVQSSEYDSSGRLIRVIGSDERYATRYDLTGNVIEARNDLGNFSYSYNDRNLVDGMTEVINGTAYSFSYVFDAAGAVIKVTYPDSSTVAYEYDDFGRLDRMLSGNDELLSLTYNRDDSVATKSECNGNSSMVYNYNYRGWATRIQANDENGTFLDLRYSYDDIGNVIRIVDAAGSAGTEQYEYDMLGRLTKATGSWGTLRYGYDSMGNRLWMNDGTNRSYSYTTYSKLTSDGTWSYAYDNNGNVVWKNSTAERYHYTYNSFGQMTSVEKQTYSGNWSPLTTIASYTYDANGARAIVSDDGGMITSVYQGHDPAYEVANGNVSEFVYVNSRLELRIEGGDSYAYISDALGSSRFVLRNGVHDAESVTFFALTYEPFGTVVQSSGFDRMTFAAEVKDSTGLVYLGARYYDPELGRFMALDPLIGTISSSQTLNRYVYCSNSPLIHTDPTGKFWHIIAGAAIGAIGGVAVGLLEHKSLEQITVMAFAGGASGAISMATLGVGTVYFGAAVNIAASVGEEAVCEYADKGSLDPTALAIAGVTGAFGCRYGFADDLIKTESKTFKRGVAVGMEAGLYKPVDVMSSVVTDKLLSPGTQSSNPSSTSTNYIDVTKLIKYVKEVVVPTVSDWIQQAIDFISDVREKVRDIYDNREAIFKQSINRLMGKLRG
jgi:RHS repeat-associated protein